MDYPALRRGGGSGGGVFCARGRAARFALLLLCFGLALPLAASAQGYGHLGFRAGAGTDVSGRTAYGGQIEYAETDGSNSVELALSGFGHALVEDYQAEFNIDARVRHTYHEETDVVGIGLLANYLFRHSMDSRGPYFVVGGGVASFKVDWRLESPTDIEVGSPAPGGGSFLDQDGLAIGSILNVGIGQRLTEHFDLRAQLPTLLVTSSDPRGFKLMPALMLSAGVTF